MQLLYVVDPDGFYDAAMNDIGAVDDILGYLSTHNHKSNLILFNIMILSSFGNRPAGPTIEALETVLPHDLVGLVTRFIFRKTGPTNNPLFWIDMHTQDEVGVILESHITRNHVPNSNRTLAVASTVAAIVNEITAFLFAV